MVKTKMIFNVPGHIDMIRKGEKTQTRRLNRGIYKVGKDYAVQRKRGVKAEKGIRIVMDKIWKEDGKMAFVSNSGREYVTATEIKVSKKDALAEGGYTTEGYEELFRNSYPKWNGFVRWAYKFHVVEVKNEKTKNN